MNPVTPKRKNAKHDLALLEQAVDAVRSKSMGLCKAAKQFNIAVSTLGDKVRGITPLKYVRPTLLTSDEEDRLAKWVGKMNGLAFDQTTDDIRGKAKAILELRGATTRDGSTMPSTSWVYRYLERHPELTLRNPMSLGKERAIVTPATIQKWFARLQAYVNSQDPSLLSDPTRLFNADESGFSFDPKSRKVIAWRGAKTVYSVCSSSKSQVTVLASMSAAGLYLPPLMIYPYKRIPGKNLLDGFPEALLQVSDNGWITSAIFFSWLRDSFIPATKHLKKPLLLLVDGHASHKSLLETSKICEDNEVILYCLPAQASHLVQPLDQAFFGSIKSAWSAATRRHIAETGDAVDLHSFARVFQPVWQCSAITAIAESSYRAAGISPLCPERVLQSGKLQPCQVFRDIGPLVPSTSKATEEPLSSTPTSLPLLEVPPSFSQPPTPVPTCSQTDHPEEEEEPMPPAPSELPEEVMSPLSPSPTALPPLEDIFPVQPPTPEPTQSQHMSSAPACNQSMRLTPAYSQPPTLAPSPSPVDSTSVFSQPPTTTPSLAPTPRPVTSSSVERNESPFYTAKQLAAIKDFGLFLMDDLSRNGFLRCYKALSSEATERENGFVEFSKLVANLKTSFEKEKMPSKSRAPLAIDDNLRVPNFSSKGKQRRKKLTPTMHYVLGAEHREAITLRENANERLEKEKLVKKTAREEKTRQRREHQEALKLKREMAKAERQEKAAEVQGKHQQTKYEALLKKLEMEAQKKGQKRKHSEGGDDENVEMEMEQTLRKADEEELDSCDDDGLHRDECKGCSKKEDEEVLVACDVCDSWWHTHCTKTASGLSSDELKDFPFVCDECCPNQ